MKVKLSYPGVFLSALAMALSSEPRRQMLHQWIYVWQRIKENGPWNNYLQSPHSQTFWVGLPTMSHFGQERTLSTLPGLFNPSNTVPDPNIIEASYTIRTLTFMALCHQLYSNQHTPTFLWFPKLVCNTCFVPQSLTLRLRCRYFYNQPAVFKYFSGSDFNPPKS
jgi:hypothetical protein